MARLYINMVCAKKRNALKSRKRVLHIEESEKEEAVQEKRESNQEGAA